MKVSDLFEFAKSGGGDGGDEFNSRLAKAAKDDGYTKGFSLTDSVSADRAAKINAWDSTDGGIYKQYFVNGFKEGRKDKIKLDAKQYGIKAELQKDGTVKRLSEARQENTYFIANSEARKQDALDKMKSLYPGKDIEKSIDDRKRTIWKVGNKVIAFGQKDGEGDFTITVYHPSKV